MSGLQFLAGSLNGTAGAYHERNQRKQEEERHRQQAMLAVLDRVVQDDTLTPEQHSHAMKVLLGAAGIANRDVENIVGAAGTFRGFFEPAQQTAALPAPKPHNNLMLGDGPAVKNWVEPPEIKTPPISGASNLGTMGSKSDEPAMVTTLPGPPSQITVPEVPGLEALQSRGYVPNSLQGGEQPSAAELERVGEEAQRGNEPSAPVMLKRPVNYDELSPRMQKIVDRKIAEQRDAYNDDLREIGERLRFSGGVYQEGADKQLDALVKKYGVNPKRPSAGGFNPLKIRNVRNAYGTDDVVYIETPDLPPVTLISGKMSVSDKLRNAISLQALNERRARDGEPPLMVNPDVLPDYGAPSGVPDVPGASPKSGVPDVPGALLVPVPGSKVPPMPVYRGYRRGGYRGGSGSSSAGNSQDLGFAESGVAGARAQAQEARARAAEHRNRGEDDLAAEQDKVAGAWEEKARVEEGRYARSGGRRPAPVSVSAAASAVGNVVLRKYTEAEIRANAKESHINPDEAVRFARQNGRLKSGN